MRSGEALAVLISLGISFLTVIGGVVVILAALRYRLQIRELRHKERLAMIDKGLTPPSEFEPRAVFNRGLKQRSLSFGIVVVGLGFALMFLIGIAAGALEAGIGIGGAVAILGIAFIVRSIYAPVPFDAGRTPDAASSGSLPSDRQDV